MKTSRKRFQVQSGGLLVEKQQHRRRMKAAEEAVEVMRLRQVVADLTERADALGLVLVVGENRRWYHLMLSATGEPVSLGRVGKGGWDGLLEQVEDVLDEWLLDQRARNAGVVAVAP